MSQMQPVMAEACVEEQYRWLTELIFDSKELDKLGGMVSEFNLFEAMGMVRQEIRHSHFLGTLLNPRESHGLGSRFFESLFARLLYGLRDRHECQMSLLDIDLCDYDDLKVFREQDRIDLLLVSEQNRQVFAIENKIDAGEHGNQLEIYERALARRYPEYRKVLVFLTLEGDQASREGWLSLSYQQVIECLSELLLDYGHQIPVSARLGIEHYITLFRRHFMDDTEIAELCRKIYSRHQKALELIFNHRPLDTSSKIVRRDLALSAMCDFFQRHQWCVDSKVNALARLAYMPWDGVARMRTSDWSRSGRVMMFEIQSANSSLDLKLLIGPTDDQELRERLFSVACSSLAPFFDKLLIQDPKWTEIFSFQLLDGSACGCGSSDEIMHRLGQKIAEFEQAFWPQLRDSLTPAIDDICRP